MMYWIVFALFTTAETITDMLLSWSVNCNVFSPFQIGVGRIMLWRYLSHF